MLGLKLESHKSNPEMLVVDHAEKAPTAIKIVDKVNYFD